MTLILKCFEKPRHLSVVAFIMSTELIYDDNYWRDILEKDIRKVSLEKKLHLVFSLVMFLQISVTQLLKFIFTSEIKEVRARAARFLGHTPTATSQDMEFPPGMVFRAWYENFPKAKVHLHNMIQPCAIEMVLEESDRLIGDKDLQITMKNLTLKSIRTLLQPRFILDKYHQLAPFTWNLLETISASPNRHRKYNAKTNEFEDDEEVEDWDDDPNCDEEAERKWDLKTPQGFSRNPVLVSGRAMRKMTILINLKATMLAISMLIFT